MEERRAHGLKTALRYALFQLPELALVTGLAWAATTWWGVPGWLVPTVLGIWVVKDVLLFPLVRRSYEPGDHVPGNELLGLSGRADDDLDPGGYVRVRHELWRAEVVPGSGPIRAGETIRVQALDGLTLLVQPEEEPDAGRNR